MFERFSRSARTAAKRARDIAHPIDVLVAPDGSIVG